MTLSSLNKKLLKKTRLISTVSKHIKVVVMVVVIVVVVFVD